MLASITLPSLMDTFLAAGKALEASSLAILLAIIAIYAAMWLYFWSKQ